MICKDSYILGNHWKYVEITKTIICKIRMGHLTNACKTAAIWVSIIVTFSIVEWAALANKLSFEWCILAGATVPQELHLTQYM